jgi:hypothetical protein
MTGQLMTYTLYHLAIHVFARYRSWCNVNLALASSMHTHRHLLRRGIPRVRMVPPPIFHHPQVVLAQLPDIAIQDRPAGYDIPVQFLSLELYVVKIVPHLVKSVRKTLTLHQSQSASGHSAQGSEDGNADVRVYAGETAENDEDGSKEKLQDEQDVSEHVEDAVLRVDVLVLRSDSRVHSVLHAQLCGQIRLLDRRFHAHEPVEVIFG